jgi:hypothetical protein
MLLPLPTTSGIDIPGKMTAFRMGRTGSEGGICSIDVVNSKLQASNLLSNPVQAVIREAV